MIILGLANWLGRTWANRFLQADRAKHEKDLENLRAQLQRDSQLELEKLKSDLQEGTDQLTRRRNVYARIATTMRVFLYSHNQNTPASQEERSAFLGAYDEGCLWASDPVVNALGTFLDLIRTDIQYSGTQQQLETEKQKAYKKCLEEMRKDSGFSETSFSYRLVNF